MMMHGLANFKQTELLLWDTQNNNSLSNFKYSTVKSVTALRIKKTPSEVQDIILVTVKTQTLSNGPIII
jgi:hypothetical protein